MMVYNAVVEIALLRKSPEDPKIKAQPRWWRRHQSGAL